MIFIAGISIALFISALLLVKKNKTRADIFLFSWMILNAAHLCFFYLVYTDTLYDYPYLLGVQFPFPLLNPVLLYFYVSSVTSRFPSKKLVVGAHFLPTILTFAYLVPFFLLPAEQKIDVFQHNGQGYEVFQSITLILVFLAGIFYVVWSSLLLRSHKKRIREEFSNLELVNLRWLQLLVYGLAVIWVIVIFTRNDTLIHLGQSVFVILIGFFGIQQKNIFKTEMPQIDNSKIREAIPESVNQEKTHEKSIEKEKYTSSGLSEARENEYYGRLSQLIEEEKIYTNSDLSLSELASTLDIHPNYLSQIINKKEDRTFHAYINDHRINEFKRLVALPKNQQFTLMSLAYDCGFNSKSTFNRYFKKTTNQTPSQYVKSLMG